MGPLAQQFIYDRSRLSHMPQAGAGLVILLCPRFRFVPGLCLHASQKLPADDRPVDLLKAPGEFLHQVIMVFLAFGSRGSEYPQSCPSTRSAPLTVPQTSLMRPIPPPNEEARRAEVSRSSPVTSSKAQNTACAQLYPSRNRALAFSAWSIYAASLH